MDLSEYAGIFQVIENSAILCLPMVVVCGIVGKIYNFLVSCALGERKMKL